MSSRTALLVFVIQLALLSPRSSAAEEGLFITRIAGGVSTVHPDTPDLGQLWNASMDLAVTERGGVIASTHFIVHDEVTTLGLGLGLKYLLMERMWNRIYLHVSPELLLVWRRNEDRRWDLAARGGLGYEHLLMWGFGFVIELHGTATAGRGDAQEMDAASVGATVGLFMEF